jgi:N-acetylneuraminic acid mutarotase
MPTSRGGIAAAVLQTNNLHVIGGEGSNTDSGVFNKHEVYSPASDRWESLEGPAIPRHGTGAVAIDGILYLPGGADVQALGPIASLERYNPD